MSSQTVPVLHPKPVPRVARHLMLGSILFGGGLLVTLLFAILAYQVLFLHRVYLGVTVGGVDAGGMTREEVASLVRRQAPEYLSRKITITDGRQQWTFSAAELGVRVDTGRTVDLVYGVGRSGSFLQDMRLHLALLGNNFNIDPVITFDTGPANYILEDLARQIERPAGDARLIIHPDLSVEAVPAQSGYRLDVKAARDRLYQAARQPGSPPVFLPVEEISPRIVEVDEARNIAATLLARPLTFAFSGSDGPRSWELEPAALVEMMTVQETFDETGVGKIALSIKRDAFTEYFSRLAAEIDRPARNAWFELNPQTFELTVLKPSQEGRTLDIARAVEAVAAITRQPVERLELPVFVQPPAVPMDDPERLGITHLWSSATTYFKGSSAGRIQNISVSAASFHGLVIPPGGIFSFNEHVGDITAENGYEESLIIRGDRTAVGIGGGVCQVSTTVFRAAFFGGFEIVERWAHGYRVSWYETGSSPGLDATIYTPDVDFKFRNDTDSFILIQTHTDREAGTVTFDFYGKPNPREVVVSEPTLTNVVPHGEDVYQIDPALPPGTVKQVDWAKDGVDVTVSRIVKENGAVLHQDTLFSRYRPWQAVYLVGPNPESEPKS